MPWGVHKYGEPTHRKKCENIPHIEMPAELLHQGEKRQKTSTEEGKNQGPQSKKGKKYQGGQGK